MITLAQMINREVHCCVSSLVSTLAQGYGAIVQANDLPELCEQAFELACPISDYEEAAIQDGWKHVGTESDRTMLFSKGTSITGQDVVRAASWDDLCDMQHIEPYDREVYEHWAVSNWLAEKLIAQGEKVDTDFAAMNVWARTTTGQGMANDSCIERIYADLVRP